MYRESEVLDDRSDLSFLGVNLKTDAKDDIDGDSLLEDLANSGEIDLLSQSDAPSGLLYAGMRGTEPSRDRYSLLN
jgi:hypothetical protein